MSDGLDRQVNTSITEQTYDTLLKIKGRHAVSPAEMARKLLDSAAAFYRQHGWFSFPVVIEPEAFQQEYLQSVAEPKAAYKTGQLKVDKPPKPPDKSQRYRGDGPRRAVS